MDELSEFLRDLYCLSTLSTVTYSSIKILCTHMNTHAHIHTQTCPPLSVLQSKKQHQRLNPQYPDPINQEEQASLYVGCVFYMSAFGGGCTKVCIR